MTMSSSSSKNWFDRLIHLLLPEPQDREQLMEVLKEAQARHILDMDAFKMIKGVVDVSEYQAKDIMIPRSQMVTIRESASLDEVLPILVESNHSRFPVLDEDGDKVLGVLLAKDLLPYGFGKDVNFDVREILRNALIIPESKRLEILLREFRQKRTHMAIVLDEYGSLAGLVTMEDILEVIIGEIEDEYDLEEEDETFIRAVGPDDHLVKALTPIETFNEYFNADFSDEDLDTIGGLVLQAIGYFPKTGEQTAIGNFEFEVVQADNRRVHLFRVRRKAA